MKTFKSEAEAMDRMRMRNRARVMAEVQVVEGPGENEATVMSLSEAIAAGFLYCWEA